MNVHNLIEWTESEMHRAQGAAEAWTRCHEELKHMIDCDNIEIKCVRESVPEPSNAERSTWPDATKNYVKMLEDAIESTIYKPRGLEE